MYRFKDKMAFSSGLKPVRPQNELFENWAGLKPYACSKRTGLISVPIESPNLTIDLSTVFFLFDDRSGIFWSITPKRFKRPTHTIYARHLFSWAFEIRFRHEEKKKPKSEGNSVNEEKFMF